LPRDVENLREANAGLADDLQKAERERDEARRMYCSVVESSARQYGTKAQIVATQLGWDCFKEETP
jgi:hypothetical protein